MKKQLKKIYACFHMLQKQNTILNGGEKYQ